MSAAPERVELPPFPAGKRLAVTTSWDDGTVHDRPLVAALNKLGIKGTFNLNSGSLGRDPNPAWKPYIQKSEVATLYAGHEVAVHTVTHPWLDRLDTAQIVREVMEDRLALEDLVGYPVRGMAYPFGTYNRQVIDALRACGIVYSRTVENRDNPWPPVEPLAWPATCHVFAPDLVERFLAFRQSYVARNAGGLFFVWGHAYEFDDRKDWPGVERIFTPLAGLADVWYCTNMQLFEYEAARQRLVVAANRCTAHNPSALTVTVRAGGRSIDVPPGQTVRLDA